MSEKHRLPRHIGIIMDGNGRWASQRGLPRIEGHRKGARSVKEVVRAAREIGGIQALTLFAFSEQNWERPPDEVEALMELLYRYVLDEHDEIMDNGIRLIAIGELSRLPAYVREPLLSLVEESSVGRDMTLCLALSYGGREDILQATRRLAEEVRSGRIDPAEINEVLFESRLHTAGLPPLDLMIRTSGELRVSNFLLWQMAYAELHFTTVKWPDFGRKDLEDALETYADRERRFGMTPDQVAENGTGS
jgi:undecaprenyl diphosphate synthase